MPSAAPRRSVSSSLSSSSPARQPESQVEVLYNTAVQSFVRRDHSKTHATLQRLLQTLRQQWNTSPDQFTAAWYDFKQPEPQGSDNTIVTHEEWLVKSLRLLVSAYASIYADPPSTSTTSPSLSPELTALLPPTSPKAILEHARSICTSYYMSTPPSDVLLPPQLISTLLLAALKLRPTGPAIDFAHQLSEDWLAALPDEFILAISPLPQTNGHVDKQSQTQRKKIESAREGYLKVVELFVGEVLTREGEWEMARAFLDGETVLSPKRKEALYRHLRSVQNQSQPIPTASPSSSLILPDDRPSSPTPTTKTKSSRRSSTSSSSSERTARPITDGHAFTPSASQTQPEVDRKGKSRAPSDPIGQVNGLPKGSDLTEAYSSNSAQSESSAKLPHKSTPSRHVKQTIWNRVIESTLRTLPTTISSRLIPIYHSPIGRYIPLPLFVIPLILIFLGARRRIRRELAGQRITATASNRVQANDVLAAARAREGGWVNWLWYYIRWWLGKSAGVWKMGTTITYV